MAYRSSDMKRNQNEDTLTISSVGDVSFAGGFTGYPEQFYSWISDEVREFLKADIRIANMEYVCLPPGEKWPGGLCLAEPPESVQALEYAGFNVVTLGNNHILDYNNEAGMLATMQCLDRAGIKYCGAGLTVDDARKPVVVETRGKKVAIFSRLHEFSFVSVQSIKASRDRPGVALLLLDELRASIKKCKDSGQADVVILCLHWGMQNLHDHSREIDQLGRELIECGADLILGHHAHVIQGLTEFNGKYCFWGQGNFYFHPYPLEGQPNGILYGPEATENRMAVASRFCFNGRDWSVEMIATVLSAENQVVRLGREKERRILKNVRGKWSRLRPIVFQFRWRGEVVKAHIKYVRFCAEKRAFWRMFKSLSIGMVRLVLNVINPKTL